MRDRDKQARPRDGSSHTRWLDLSSSSPVPVSGAPSAAVAVSKRRLLVITWSALSALVSLVRFCAQRLRPAHQDRLGFLTFIDASMVRLCDWHACSDRYALVAVMTG